MYKTYTMTTTVTLAEETADQSLLAYAVMKGYHPTVQGEVTVDVEEEFDEEVDGEVVTKKRVVQKVEIQEVPNPVSPLEYISQVKQKDMVEDMLVLSVSQIETYAQKQIEATRQTLSKAVNVSIE